MYSYNLASAPATVQFPSQTLEYEYLMQYLRVLLNIELYLCCVL